jgi:hypothetical protein
MSRRGAQAFSDAVRLSCSGVEGAERFLVQRSAAASFFEELVELPDADIDNRHSPTAAQVTS